MEFAVVFYLAIIGFVSLLFFLMITRNSLSACSKRLLPPGSMGLPIIGQSLGLLKAMRNGRDIDWLFERARKYGPISKLHIFGTPTVFLHGQETNKFIFTSNDDTLCTKQPPSIRRLFGERNLLEVIREDHDRLRGAFMLFMKPEALKQSVAKMDQEIRLHLHQHWHQSQEIRVMPLMKALTFNVICTVLFGIERGERREKLVYLFEQLMDGLLAMPINFPFTRFNRSLRARSKVEEIIKELIHEKRAKLDLSTTHHQDFITSLLSMRRDETPLVTDEEIVDNCVVAMVAGHDTTSSLLTVLIKLLSENPQVYDIVLKEQEEIARGKSSGEEHLTWDDLAKMKYTWRVATEALRMYPPVMLNFRRVVKDIEIGGGYIIPKGWQVVLSGHMTHMDESIFPDANKFNPSRYEKVGAIPPHTFVAFGGGSRMCPGNEFARIETLTMIHYLVTGFRWKLCLEKNDMARDPMPVFKQGLPIFIQKSTAFMMPGTGRPDL